MSLEPFGNTYVRRIGLLERAVRYRAHLVIVLSYLNLLNLRLQLLLALLVLAFPLALAGCKAEINIAVDEEGNGEIEIIGAVNNTVMALANLGGEDPFESILEIPEEADGADGDGIVGASIERYSESGYTGVRIKADFDAYDPAFTALSQDDSMLGSLTEQTGLGGFNFTRTAEDDGWTVQLRQDADPVDTSDFSDLLDEVPFDLEDVDLPLIVSLRLPGDYVEHNADREVDGMLIWDANLLDGIDLYAVSRDQGSQIELVPIIITTIFALIFGGIVIGVVVSRERRRRRLAADALNDHNADANVADDDMD